MKILVFGFKPYQDYKENITEKIVKRLMTRKNLQKVVLPVKFSKKFFLKAVEKYKPDVILGLGQHPRSKKITIERRAVNLKQTNRKEKPRKIEKRGSKYRLLNLKLKQDKDARICYDAGKYVCNYCMYIISEFARKKDIKFAFLHIPKDYSITKARKFIEAKIDEVCTD